MLSLFCFGTVRNLPGWMHVDGVIRGGILKRFPSGILQIRVNPESYIIPHAARSIIRATFESLFRLKFVF